MARHAPIGLFSITLAACMIGAVALGQTESPTPSLLAPKKAEPASTQTAPREAPRRVRAISPEVAAQLAASAPKYTPAPPKPAPAPKVEESLVDMRDVDKPRNNIIRLPKYIVREATPPVFTERAINTQKGLTAIAMSRYISETDRALNRFTIPLFGTSAEKRAMTMYAEDERLNNMAEMKDTARAAAQSDPAQGSYILRESQKTYMRTNDFGWRSGSSK